MQQKSTQAIVGVVTVTYNSAGVITDFMRSTLAQTYPDFILYIIDNASSDTTLMQVQAYNDPRIVLIANQENYGVAKGNNQGIQAAIADGCTYILLINNDTEFDPSLIKKLLEGLTEHQCQMIVPKIMYHSEPNIIWCAGGGFNKWRFHLPFHIGKNELDQGQHDTPQPITYAPTCCMLIEHDVFDKTGYMDEVFFVYFDDVDFCFRAMQKGIRMFYIPVPKLMHKVSVLTEGYGSPFSTRYHFRNRLYFLRKHFSPMIWGMWFVWFQLHLVFDLITRKSTLENFVAKQKSLQSGLRLKLA